MAECSECGDSVSMPFKCKFCGERFCSKHRLPENHDCQGLESYKEEKKKEDHEITYNVQRQEQEYRQKQEEKPVNKIKRTFHRWKNKLKRALGMNSVRQQPHRRQAFTGAMQQTFPEIATFTLLSIILVGFLLQLSFSGFTDMFSLVPSAIFDEPWRIVTTIFLHGGTGHLLVNSMVLYFFGAELEKRVGTKTFLKVFFISGIIASLGFTGFMHVWGDPAAAAVGASGALYGVFAALAVMAPEIRVLAFFIIPMGIRTALVGFALLDVFLLTQNTPIASAAHLAGLVTGLYYGYKLRKKQRSRQAGIQQLLRP